MKPEKQPIDQLEKKVWQLVLLAVVVILYLTVSLLGVQFLGFLGESNFIMVTQSAYKYSVFLAILILLFCGYMIVQQRKLLVLSRSFLSEQEKAYMLSENVKILSALFKVSAKINAREKLSDILNVITKDMLSCFDADRSSIMLLDKKSKMLKTMASFGKGAEHAQDALVPLGKGIAGWVVENGKPLLLNGQVEPAEFPGTEKKKSQISSALSVPLKIGEESIGVLNVNLEKDRSFSETHLKLISIFANNAAVAIYNAMLSKERVQRVRLQTMFGQLHSPRVVQELIEKVDNLDHPRMMREKREVTVLFADIRGFSNLMSSVELEVVMDFLDEFYRHMTKAVFDNEGNVDKFIGDEVMVFFGAPNVLENSAENALSTAVEMVTSFKTVRERFSEISSNFEKMGISVGINTGEAFVGNVGSMERYEYTVIGNAVNIARRLCSHAESGQILVTEKTLNKASRKVPSDLVGNISLKGIANPVNVHKLSSSGNGVSEARNDG
jgi:adenylate cyclase